MSSGIWNMLGSLKLTPSFMILCSYDGYPSQQQGILKNVSIELVGKSVLIDIEVFNAPLDYNIPFGFNYMYSMKVVASTIFLLTMFPHEGKIMTID